MPVDANQSPDTDVELTNTNANDSPSASDNAIDTGAVGSGTDATVIDNAAVTDDAAGSQLDPDAWRKSYEELGFQNLESPEQAQQRMIEAFRQRDEQLREAREQVRYMQSVHSRLESLGGSSPQPPSAPAASKPSDPLTELTSGWQEPDRELIAQYVVTGEDGQPAWRSDTPAEIRAQVDQYKVKQAAWHKILNDPRQLDQVLNQRVERMLAERLDETLTQRDTQTADQRAEQQFLTENHWLYERDPVTGGTAVDPNTGRPMLSREGHQFTKALHRVRESGVSRRSDQLELALAMHRSQQSQARQAPAQQRATVQPTVDQQRAAMLGRTNQRPAKPTTAAGITDGAGASRTGAKRESLGVSLVNDLIEEGMI
jgi:hypothetical protein